MTWDDLTDPVLRALTSAHRNANDWDWIEKAGLGDRTRCSRGEEVVDEPEVVEGT